MADDTWPTRLEISGAVDELGWRLVLGHDIARGRIDAALAAGGRVLSDSAAPAFWILADAEGNEACICTWQGRD
jgi:hypothetical protein